MPDFKARPPPAGACSRPIRLSFFRIAVLKDTLLATIQPLLTSARDWVERHPRSVAGAALSLLFLSGGAYALASAVVALGPDVAQVPVHEVSEPVTPLPLQPQADALDTYRFNLYRSAQTRSSDTADTLLKRLGVDDPAAAAFLRSDANSQRQLLGRVGRHLTAEVNDDNTLVKLSARWSSDVVGRFTRLTIEKSQQAFSSKLETLPLIASTRIASGIIQSSLFAATDESQVPDAVAGQIAEIFSGDIDFHRDLRRGDRFSVVYEVLEGDGEPLRAGRVLSAEFVNAGKAYQAMWFQEPAASGADQALAEGRPTDGMAKSGYYTLNGESLRRAYLASPLAFSRVTSGFKMRFHPILKQWRAHLGVDYAAPVGTAVRSVGDGVVDFAGVQNGFGNVVFIRHRNNHTTVYAHLSRIAVHRGQRVQQGQNIGATGASGWATGPHLHYEFRVNGVHQNPLAIARKSESVPVAEADRPVFLRQASVARQQLAAASQAQSVQ